MKPKGISSQIKKISQPTQRFDQAKLSLLWDEVIGRRGRGFPFQQISQYFHSAQKLLSWNKLPRKKIFI